jgi:hypothetical protein
MSGMNVQHPQPGAKKSSGWKWVLIGCGCLTFCIIAAAVAFFLILGGVMAGMKQSEPYRQAVKLVQSNPEVREELGEIEFGWFVTGNVKSEGTREEADFKIPVKGTKGKGSLEVELKKRSGRWTFDRAELNCESGKRINLLGGTSSTIPEAPETPSESPTESPAGTPSESPAQTPSETPSPGGSLTPAPSGDWAGVLKGGEPSETKSPDEDSTPEESGEEIIEEATMCRRVDSSQKPVEPTTAYPPEAKKFYCSILMGDVPGEMKVKAVYKVDYIKGYRSNQTIDEVELKVPGNHYASFSLARSVKEWPEGTYRVDLYCAGKLIKSLKFEVRR